MCRIHREMLIRLCLVCPLLLGRLKSCSLSLSSSILKSLSTHIFPPTHSNVTLINLFFLASKLFDRFFFVASLFLRCKQFCTLIGLVFGAAFFWLPVTREFREGKWLGDYQSAGNSADKLILCTFLL
jgi:hypothetical protein